MNFGDGALEHLWVVFTNSEIKSGFNLADHAENEVEVILSDISRKILMKIWIYTKNRETSTLKAGLAMCGCGMNFVDGALEHLWELCANSKIKSGG